MIADFHFLRPFWWLAIIPLCILINLLWNKKPRLQGWDSVCDPHLLTHLIHNQSTTTKYHSSWLYLFLSLFFIILGLTGPSWSRLPVPSYHPAEARIFLLDLSEDMTNTDLSPDRLSRAKFTLQDILAKKGVGQFGMIAYTSEPFIVSPLTEDGLTISALLPSLTPDIMPIQGQNLPQALQEATKLLEQAGFTQGSILVLTGETPSQQAINIAATLAKQGIVSSIVALRKPSGLNPLFTQFAQAGEGELLPVSPNSTDIDHWLSITSHKTQFNPSKNDLIAVWRDEGRWFLLPALLLLLPVFRRGWLQRIEI